jgi:hypothetical protein
LRGNPDVRREDIADAVHLPNMERPEAFNSSTGLDEKSLDTVNDVDAFRVYDADGSQRFFAIISKGTRNG